MHLPPRVALIFGWLAFARPPLASAEPPRLGIEAPASAASGALVEATASLDVGESEVLAWSFAVAVEGLAVLEATTAGTDFERLSRGGFAETVWEDDAFATVGVLSFSEAAALPAGTTRLLRAVARVSRKDPGAARLFPREGYESPAGGAIANEVLLAGGSRLAISTSEAAVSVRGCAGYLLSAAGGPPGSVPAGFELPPRGEIALEIWIRVASPDHLRPTGFSLALRHDPAALEIQGAEFFPEFVGGFVRADGSKAIAAAGDRAIASAVSSRSSPVALAPGDHRAIRVSYRLAPDLRPRDAVRTRVEFDGDFDVETGSPATSFQPGDALPCDLFGAEFEISVSPDDWIRGDANGDKRTDISDAIGILGDLFLGSEARCRRAMEANGDGAVDLADAVYLLNHLFTGGPAPPAPFPECGWAPTELPCAVSACLP